MEVGNVVRKISGRPFKNGNKTQVITSFGRNMFDPKLRTCAFFDDGSACNLDQLELVWIPSTKDMLPTEYLCCKDYQVTIKCTNRITLTKWYLQKLIPLTSVWNGNSWISPACLDFKFFDSPEAAWEEYWTKVDGAK